MDILQSDEGNYLCRVYSWTDKTINNVAQDSITIELYAFPTKMFPLCESDPNTLTLRAGNRVVFTCLSEKGFPAVQLNWRCINSNVPFFLHDSSISGNTLESEITLTVDASYNGAIFECKMTSDGFPDRQRICTIGPLKIAKDSVVTDKELSTQPTVKSQESNGKQNIMLKGEICNTPCPPEDHYSLLYWAMATVGTTILMFIFLTTTIMYCCKYFTISGEVVAAQGSFSSGDGTEPVYVSLQRRQPERNSMFMSVEDPNNPGNKVLMPRDVFDEFYRSLSLKKRESNH